MGDPFEVISFLGCMDIPVKKWHDSHKLIDPGGTALEATINVPLFRDVKVDLSLVKFADDLTKRMVDVCSQGLAHLAEVAEKSNGQLAAALEPYGMAQNLGKEQTVISLVGKGASRDREALERGRAVF